jgi:hypothetical protein
MDLSSNPTLKKLPKSGEFKYSSVPWIRIFAWFMLGVVDVNPRPTKNSEIVADSSGYSFIVPFTN